ncbi:hypothetical protein GE061_005502 [Apolygus lucorum]|uniref:Uncharacterized protein n=1 Tax=Apolygus lucorum TaxID=248454 RepID=A0A8S9X0F2_APOLU|nr:hypothetical protein GE061_005502 [Apolygus lucorum]
MNCDAKLFCSLLLGRLESHVQSLSVLKEYQAGFRRGAFDGVQRDLTYVLYCETGIEPIFLYSLRLHVDYLLRVWSMPQDRYPLIIARDVAGCGLFWQKGLNDLADKNGCEYDGFSQSRGTLQSQLNRIIEEVGASWREVQRERALHSSNPMYSQLNLDLRCASLVSGDEVYPFHAARWLIKLRGALLSLNSRPSEREPRLRQECSLCNLQEPEDVAHFLGRCSVLRDFRIAAFGKMELAQEDIISVLNGQNLKNLVGYCQRAWCYRAELVREFNW